MITLDVLKALRVIALAEADERTFDAWYKSLCRWYSREFSTPLPQVLDMSMEDVFSTYFEDTFWKLKTGDETQQESLQGIIDSLLADEHEEYQDIVEQQEEEDDAWYQEELKQIEADLQAKKTSKVKGSKAQGDSTPKPDNPNLNTKAQTHYVQVDDEIILNDEEN